jgi:hypothetical protein
MTSTQRCICRSPSCASRPAPTQHSSRAGSRSDVSARRQPGKPRSLGRPHARRTGDRTSGTAASPTREQETWLPPDTGHTAGSAGNVASRLLAMMAGALARRARPGGPGARASRRPGAAGRLASAACPTGPDQACRPGRWRARSSTRAGPVARSAGSRRAGAHALCGRLRHCRRPAAGRRRHAAAGLRSRVRLSAFECDLASAREAGRLRARLRELIDPSKIRPACIRWMARHAAVWSYWARG